MNLKSRSTTFAAVSAAFLLFSAAPVQAQGLVSVGRGSYLSPSSGVDINSFAYFLTDRGNGTARGLVYWQLPNITVVWRVTSFGFYEFTPGTTSLAFAGPIVTILGNPRPGLEVGSTAYTAINADGLGSSDATAGFSAIPPLSLLPPVPPQFGDLTTIQQIVGFGRFYNFPDPVFAPLLSGNILIR